MIVEDDHRGVIDDRETGLHKPDEKVEILAAPRRSAGTQRSVEPADCVSRLAVLETGVARVRQATTRFLYVPHPLVWKRVLDESPGGLRGGPVLHHHNL